jgi:hypothetical protein
MAFRKDVYIFSKLNEKSIALADSISNHHNTLIVFTDVSQQNETDSYDIVEKAK